LIYIGEPIWHYGGRSIDVQVNDEIIFIINGEGELVKDLKLDGESEE
jgi:hypothetical protein